MFSAFAADPWAVFLDSGAAGAGGGRFDVLAVSPRLTLMTRGPETEIGSCEGVRVSGADPLELVREALGPPRSAAGAVLDLPFTGGAVGWLGYDLARRFETVGLRSALAPGAPQMAVGIYDWALVVDHRRQSTWLVGWGEPSDPARLRLRSAAIAPRGVTHGRFEVISPLGSNFDAAGYRERFARVQRYIRAGDCYQVNLARRWSAPARGDAWTAYLHLRASNRAPFAAYLRTPDVTVLSASPERFLRVRNGAVTTCPIKGTIRRDADPERDRALAARLVDSPKDRAENLMIVDLLRNDIGRSCAPGSVRVPELFAVKSFPGVHHLVSTVTGRLAKDRDALALLRGCFPGGSVTGAPKIRTMQIIDELEGEARGLYCGSIGYLGFDGTMDSNIAIRTMTLSDGRLSFWAGGGLVADSRCDAEWSEIAIKARAMLELARHFRTDARRHGGSSDP
ncbi:MAG: aminodeoxychorismate synthase component I [Thiohalocapsa sp.]